MKKGDYTQKRIKEINEALALVKNAYESKKSDQRWRVKLGTENNIVWDVDSAMLSELVRKNGPENVHIIAETGGAKDRKQ